MLVINKFGNFHLDKTDFEKIVILSFDIYITYNSQILTYDSMTKHFCHVKKICPRMFELQQTIWIADKQQKTTSLQSEDLELFIASDIHTSTETE